MSIRVQISSTVRPECLTQLLPFLQSNLPNVRAFDGCMSVTILMNQDTRSLVLSEEWQSVDQHQKYLSSIEESGILQKLAAHFEGPPSVQYYDRLLI